MKVKASNNILKLKKGEKVAKQSALLTIILTALKGLCGIISGSVALLADAIHSLSDILSCLAIYIGLKLAQLKLTEKFPYGLYKAETFAFLVVSIIIIFSGIEIFIESFNRFFTPPTISLPLLALLATAISAIVSYFMAKYKEKIGKEINSRSLVSEGKHSRIDFCLSFSVFIGIVFSYFGFPSVEALIGLIISLFVIKLGLSFGKDAILILMDVCLEPETISKIKKIAENVEGVKGVHTLKVRRSGPFLFGEMHILVKKELTVKKAHKITEEIERRVKRVVKEIDSIIIHVEPVRKERLRVAIPTSEKVGLKSKTSIHFGDALYFVLIDVEKNKIKNWITKENPARKLKKKRGIIAANFLVRQKVDIVLAKELGEGPFHVLRDNFVEMYKIPRNIKVEKAINLLIDKKLKPITVPKHEIVKA